MTNWFFLSHARFDRDNDKKKLINRFYEDLLSEIRRRKGRDGSAFIDADGIQPGDLWDKSLARSLSTCRVLVCMYSLSYFNSEFCGKEFQIFYDRLEKHKTAEDEHPPLILPVMYTAPEDFATKPVTGKIQYTFDEFPADYKENGLHYIMARKTKEEDYLDFIDLFATRLIQVAAAHVLTEEKDLVDIEAVPSAWNIEPPKDDSNDEDSGPDLGDTVEYADFVFAAARRNEIESLREAPQIDRYGNRGGIDWTPYRPDLLQPVGQFTQMVASREGFYYKALELNEDLIEEIKNARRGNRIVIIIVDTWTLALKNYYEILTKYDDFDSLNSSMIIVWNNKDEFTTAKRSQLESYIRRTFPTKSARSGNVVFVNNVGSQEDLDSFLAKALHELKAQILRVNSDFRTIGAGEAIPILGGK